MLVVRQSNSRLIDLFIYYNLMAKKKLRIHRIKSHKEGLQKRQSPHARQTTTEKKEEQLRSSKIKNTTSN